MELEKLIWRGTKGIATLGLAGLLGAGSMMGLGGCAAKEMTKGEQRVVAGQILMQTGDSDLTKIGSILYSLGILKHQEEIARIRSNININMQQNPQQNGQPQYMQQGLPINVVSIDGKYSPAPGYTWVNPNDSSLIVERNIHVFAANGWRDYNGDGLVKFPDEFPGYGRNEFYETERIEFVLHNREGIRVQLSFEVYNPQGDVSFSNSEEIIPGAYRVGGEGRLMNYLIENGGYGTHSISFKMNGFYVGSTEVRIIPSPKRK